MIDIRFDKGKNRAVAFDTEKGIEIGVCELVLDNDTFVIEHTEVNSEYKGMGIAKKLIDKVVEEMRAIGKKLKATCSYAQQVLDRSDEYKDVVSK